MNNIQVKKIMGAFNFELDEEITKKDGLHSFYKFTDAFVFDDLTDGSTFYTVRVAFSHQDEDNKKDINGISWIEVCDIPGDSVTINDCHDIEAIIKYYGNQFKGIFPFICNEKIYE